MLPAGSGRIVKPAGLLRHRQKPHAETRAGFPVAGDRNDVRSTHPEAGDLNVFRKYAPAEACTELWGCIGLEARRDNGAPVPRVMPSRIMIHQPVCGS